MSRHRQARRGARIPQSVTAVAILLVALAISPAEPATAALEQDVTGTDVPILWSGTLADRSGKPTRGEVAVFVRPPAATIPAAGTGEATGSGIAPVPLATDTTGTDGAFELRSSLPWARIPRHWVDPSGGVTVMVFAVAETGEWTVAMDTVWYLDEAGATPSWFTSNHQYEAARRVARTPDSAMRASLARSVEEADAMEATAGERRSVLRADQAGTAPVADGTRVAAAGPPPPPSSGYFGCAAIGSIGDSWQYRTADMVDMATYWKHRVEYKKSSSTSWEVGYSAQGTPPWSYAGTVTFSTSSAQGVWKDFNSNNIATYRETWRIGVRMRQVNWACRTTTSPGPFYVRTAEAYGLTWDTQSSLSGDDIGCYDWNNFHGIAGKAGYWRESGQSASAWANVGIWGFYGGQKITTNSEVRYRWYNDSIWSRHLCGETGSVTSGHTRVSALDI